ncbi:MAG: PEP-CTERM sorting domain-containing protein [Candidatus Hydrogenedentes bacterium]|nr:PEP-CTERM sorting domain-containing protein [Candidatus Hydrogenedentota bacterium]
MLKILGCAFGVLLVALFAMPAFADSITIFGSETNPESGSLLQAQAVVSYDGNGTLTVVLANVDDVALKPSDLLTALFFSVSGGYMLAPVSAVLTSGSAVLNGPDGGGNVGGEWAYGDGLVGAPNGATSGISSSGFGLFGTANFNGVNLAGPVAVDGMNYGIDYGIGPGSNNAVLSNPTISNSVTFNLSVADDYAGFSLANLSNWSFQYGTALDEPNFPPDEPGIPVPEPATWSIVGIGMLGLFAGRFRNKL